MITIRKKWSLINNYYGHINEERKSRNPYFKTILEANEYWSKQYADKIKQRSNPGVTYAVYTDFESDEHGEYTYFIGELVNSVDGQDLTFFLPSLLSQVFIKNLPLSLGKCSTS
jgi:hypothetical protein